MSQDPFPFEDALPHFILPYVVGWTDVDADGNCGFRCVPKAGYGNEKLWSTARWSMGTELQASENAYVNAFFKSKEMLLESFRRIQGHLEGPAPFEHWMSAPNDLFPVATVTNMMWIFLSTPPGPRSQTAELCISILPI